VYLEHVRIRNFRNLRDVEVWLRPGFNVVVGRNNTGKSNLFLAIRHALGPIATRGDWLPPLTRDDIFHDGAAHTADPIRIDLSFAGLSEHQRAQFFEILDYAPERPEHSRARVYFEVQWDAEKGRYRRPKRWGGVAESDSDVPYEILRSLPVTFLPALRDAEQSLSPGRGSRVAQLLEELARTRPERSDPERIRRIFANANTALEADELIQEAVSKLRSATRSMAGSDYVGSSVNATDADFGRILRSLRILVDQSPIVDLSSSGLGYNNLLFMATVLSHLRETAQDEVPLLLIEEPEAHLHPQLAERLGTFLSGQLPGLADTPPQTIVATHSPTLASKTRPRQVSVIFESRQPRQVICNSLGRLELTDPEERSISRMLDITRASIFFAKGLILVEGVSEELLVPAFARLLEVDLAQHHISVVPLCGVAFSTLGRVLDRGGLGVPVAVVTDGDPPVKQEGGWKTATPRRTATGFEISPRTASLLTEFEDHPYIRVFHSGVTLEFDCAAAGDENANLMVDVWEEGYPGGRTVQRSLVESSDEKALELWRGICCAHHGWSKADFAHLLAARIEGLGGGGGITVPPYIEDAIRHVVRGASSSGDSEPPMGQAAE
jgi:putative ATP-dependent endonuclease of OLD family